MIHNLVPQQSMPLMTCVILSIALAGCGGSDGAATDIATNAPVVTFNDPVATIPQNDQINSDNSGDTASNGSSTGDPTVDANSDLADSDPNGSLDNDLSVEGSDSVEPGISDSESSDDLSAEQNTPVAELELPESVAVDFRFTLPEQLIQMREEQMIFLQFWTGSVINPQLRAGDLRPGPGSGQWDITLTGIPVNNGGFTLGVDALVDSSFPHRRISSTRLSDPNQGEGQLLARATVQQEITSSATNIFAESFAGDFDTDFDSDFDGRSNLDETFRGTDALFAGFDYEVFFIRGSQPPIVDGSLADDAWRDWTDSDNFARSVVFADRWLSIDEDYLNTEGVFAGLSRISTEGVAVERTVPEFLHRFQVIHDLNSLYIGILVEDDTAWFDSGDQWFQDDSVEIYIDSDNSRLSQYDGDNDLALGLRTIASDFSIADLNLNTFSTAAPGGLRYAVGRVVDPGAPSILRTFYEISIPFADLGLQSGDEFGLEIQVNSDANGGDRDAKWQRNGPRNVDRTFFDPRYFSFVRISPNSPP